MGQRDRYIGSLRVGVTCPYEAWGRGIERIIKGCNEDGFSTVDFRYDACRLWTTFRYQYPARVVGNTENIQKTIPTTTLTGHETAKETSLTQIDSVMQILLCK